MSNVFLEGLQRPAILPNNNNSGGGSSLPDITAEDEGKLLTVVQDYGTLEVIPEQSVTLTDHKGTLTGVDFSEVTDTTVITVTAIVGGYTQTIQCPLVEGEIANSTFNLWFEDDVCYIYDNTGYLSTFTIKGTIPVADGDPYVAWEGGAVADLTVFENYLQYSLQEAVTAATNSGFVGVSNATTNTISSDQANLIIQAAKIGKFKANNNTFVSLQSWMNEATDEASVLFIMKHLEGYSDYYLITFYVSTYKQSTNHKIEVQAQAVKLISYPTNG